MSKECLNSKILILCSRHQTSNMQKIKYKERKKEILLHNNFKEIFD